MPPTRYARSGSVSIAYQALGDGPMDVVIIPGAISHLEHGWTHPRAPDLMRRLLSFARVIVFDKRGTGMSDRDMGVATLEERMDDVRAVMDAVGSERAAIYGLSEGGALAITFAATHADRTEALVLYGAFPRMTAAPDWPGITLEEWERRTEEAVENFGNGPDLANWAPSAPPGDQEWWGANERLGASPSASRKLMVMNRDIDVRSVLPTISVPTLVLHRRGDRIVPVGAGRYIAAHIPGARLVELDGEDHLPYYGDIEALNGEIEEFLTGSRRQGPVDRVLATVVFTDIVGSTELAVELGDAGWRAVLDRHDDVARRRATEHRGRIVKSTGDGVLATFDGPARATLFAADLGRDLRRSGVDIRTGVHTGEVELRDDDIGGLAVHVAARIEALASPGEILASRTVKDLTAGSGLGFSERGTHHLKGIPDEWQLYAVSVP